MIINQAIFRAYDIRGHATKDLSPEIAYKIGCAFAEMVTTKDNNKIVVGRDGRISSPSLCDALIRGLKQAGAEVVFIGIVPSPALYFADKKLGGAGGIMVTASHNPKEDNGFKMIKAGESFFGDMIQDLKKRVLNPGLAKDMKSFQESSITSFTEEYIDRIFQNISVNPKLRIAFDPANGSAGQMVKMICKRLPCHTFLINDEIDGNFPAHKPDPTIAENMVQLRGLVLDNFCDIGIGFDGDGDRIGVVTKQGDMLYGDQLLCIYASSLLKKNPGCSIIADVKASKVLFDHVKALGGNPIMWRTGHSFIKAKIKESGALLAGEMSGHMFFADDYYGYDDALYASLRLIDILSSSDESLDEMIAHFPKVYNTPEIKIAVADSEKFEIIKRIKQQAKEEDLDFADIDGLRVTNEHGWWLLRASNTQAAIIARCESTSKEGLERLKEEIDRMLNSVTQDK